VLSLELSCYINTNNELRALSLLSDLISTKVNIPNWCFDDLTANIHENSIWNNPDWNILIKKLKQKAYK